MRARFMESKLSDHQQVIRSEFSRQAETMDSAIFFTDAGILDRIRKAAALTREQRAIDVACGPGIVAEVLAQDAGEVIACDITPEMLARAAQRFERAGLTNARCIPGTAESLPFDDGSFDVVFTRSSIHHFPNPDLALREMVRVMRPSGRVIIQDVTSSEVVEESALHNALERVRDPSHVRMLPESELLAHIRDAGLEVDAITGWTNHHELDEWLKIANAPDRDKPLRIIMRALAEAGVRAGINLRLEADKVLFDHHPLLVVAKQKHG
jgi:ubiquinone/menaquinone biosynthesis C-methylase UbiE